MLLCHSGYLIFLEKNYFILFIFFLYLIFFYLILLVVSWIRNNSGCTKNVIKKALTK